jgi:membrane-associated PAP2 superfamily phosphatase
MGINNFKNYPMRINCYYPIPLKNYGHYPTGLNSSGFILIAIYVIFYSVYSVFMAPTGTLRLP